MNIAFALFRYFPFGGLQKDMLAIARCCVAAGHTVTVYCGTWEGEQPDGIAVQILPVQGVSNHVRNRSFAALLAQVLVKNPADVVAGFDRLPNLDVYYAADTCFRAKLEQERPFFYRWLPRYRQFLIFEQAVFGAGAHTQVLTLAERSRQEYAQYYPQAAARMQVLPPGIARDRMAPPDVTLKRAHKRSELGIQDHQHLLLMVGSGFRTKGVDRALRALAALPEVLRAQCVLLIAGQDNAAPFQALAASLGVAAQVQFLGGRNDVSDLLLAADVLLHPAYRENTGTVLLEAAIAGLPVLATAACGYAHYIREHNLGRVIDEPFAQTSLDSTLADMLQQRTQQPWAANGIHFGKTADIYAMPQRVADIIADIGRRKASTGNK